MAGYLLDANIVSALMHEPVGRLAQRIARAGEGNVFTSVIVAAELAYGGVKKPSARLSAALATVFRELDIKPLETEAVRHYARLRHQLEQALDFLADGPLVLEVFPQILPLAQPFEHFTHGID